MPWNRNDARLAYLNANRKINDSTIKDLATDGSLNYQLPSKSIFKSTREDLSGCTALHIASKHEDLDSVRLLLRSGAVVTVKDVRGMTAVHRAVERERSSIDSHLHKLRGPVKDSAVNALLSAHLDNNITENPRSDNGISHLHAACITNNVDVVEHFLRNGVSPDESVHANSPILPGYTPLHFAARYCSAEVARVLLRRGARPHAKDASDSTPMQILLKRNMQIADWMHLGGRARCGYLAKEYKSNESTIEAILEANDEDILDDTGLSRLHVACTLRDTSILEKLLEETTSLEQCVRENSRQWPGYTALHFAAHFNPAAVKLLMSRGANMLIRAANAFAPLDLCLQRYKAEIVHDLLASHADWREIRFSDGRTKLLDFVLSMRSEDEFEDFLEGRDANAFVPQDSPILPGYSPLHLATVAPARTRSVDELLKDTLYATRVDESDVYNCDEGEDELYMKRIELLLDKSPDFNIAAKHHESTALHLAFTLQRPDAAKAIAEKYSKSEHCDKLNLRDSDGLSHFEIACATGVLKLAEVLLRMYRSQCRENSYLPEDYEFAGVLLAASSTPLHIAVAMNHAKLVEFLLNEDFDIYDQDVDGMTPIHRAFAVKATETCELLFKSKIESLEDREEDDGLTHLHVACAMRHARTVATLLRTGADVNARVGVEFEEDPSVRGLTALQIAIRERSREIAGMLLRSGADVFVQPLKYADELYDCYPDLFLEAMERHESLAAIHVACFAVDVERVRRLLDAGADPNAKVHAKHPVWPNYTPLHMLAAERRRRRAMPKSASEVARMMIERGADVMLTNGHGATPLHEAFSVDEKEVVDRGFFVSKAWKSRDEGTKIPERLEKLLKMPAAGVTTQVAHAWNGGDASEYIDIKLEDPLTLYRKPKAQSTDGIRGKIGFARGLHVWEIDWSTSQRGTHAVVGVATADAPMRAKGYSNLLGSNECSCGWDVNRKVLVNNSGVDYDRDVYPGYLRLAGRCARAIAGDKDASRDKPIEDFQVPDKITVVLDMDEGTLAYMVDGKYLGVAFEGLKGKTIYPAVSAVWGHAEITMTYIGCLETASSPSILDTLLSGHRDFNVNPTDPKGISTFHIACHCNNLAVVEEFLKHNINFDRPIDHFSDMYAGYAPLHLAARHKSAETLDLLIEYGADVRARDREGDTPLHRAADYSSGERSGEEVLVGLFEAGADPEATNKFGQTPVEILMETKGISGKTAEMFLKSPRRVNTFNGFNAGYIATAISRASTVEDVRKHPVYAAVIERPEDNGADAFGRTPVHNIVALRSRLDEKPSVTAEIYVGAIEGLMKLKFDVDQYDHEGRTPLHYAVKFQNAAAILALLELGADFNIVDIDGETPYSLGLKLRKEVAPGIFTIFARHLRKLKLAKLEVSEVNEEVYENRVDASEELLDCEEELELMENVDVGGFTMREFLSDENALTLYEKMDESARETFDELFEIGREEKLVLDYPEFSGILRMQYRKVRAKATLPSAAVDSSFFSSLYSYLSWS